MKNEPIEDKQGVEWLRNKLSQIDAQIRELDNLKAQREMISKMLRTFNGVDPESEATASKSEAVVQIVIELINQHKRPVASSEILAAAKEKGIQLGSAITKSTSSLSAILDYELNKRKAGSRLIKVKRGFFNLKK